MARTHGGDRSEGGQWHVHACTSNGSPQCAKKPMGQGTRARPDQQLREHAMQERKQQSAQRRRPDDDGDVLQEVAEAGGGAVRTRRPLLLAAPGPPDGRTRTSRPAGEIGKFVGRGRGAGQPLMASPRRRSWRGSEELHAPAGCSLQGREAWPRARAAGGGDESERARERNRPIYTARYCCGAPAFLAMRCRRAAACPCPSPSPSFPPSRRRARPGLCRPAVLPVAVWPLSGGARGMPLYA